VVRNIAIMAVCNLKKCKSIISAEHQSNPCHSCENIFHAKCLGYSVLVRDAIDMRSDLRYYCDECIAYELFRSKEVGNPFKEPSTSTP